MTRLATALLALTLALPALPASRPRTPRSASAKAALKRQQHCPSTGKRALGYVIDHFVLLACRGADAPSNSHSRRFGRQRKRTSGNERDTGECQEIK